MQTGLTGIVVLLALVACTVDLPAPPDPVSTRMGTDIDVTVPDDVDDDAEPPVADDLGLPLDFEIPMTDLPDLGAPPDVEPDSEAPDIGAPDTSKPECQCAPDETCVNGECIRSRWTYEAESEVMSHETGGRTENGWAASVLLDEIFAFLTRGPYVDDVPAGHYEAVFYLAVGISFGDVEAAYLDVNDYDGEPDGCLVCSLASRAIRTADFTGPGSFQQFSLEFDNPGDRRLEFRVFFVGWVDIEIDRVELKRIFE